MRQLFKKGPVKVSTPVGHIAKMIQLCTMPQGHPDCGFICQEMWRKIQSVHPKLAEAGRFIDWQKYRLGRLQSEMRTEFKTSAIKMTPGASNNVEGWSILFNP